MPYGNRKGPEGQGPMTGRAQGYCSGNDSPGYTVPSPGRGNPGSRGFGNRKDSEREYGRGNGSGKGTGRGSRKETGGGIGRGSGRRPGRGLGKRIGEAAGRGLGLGLRRGFKRGWNTPIWPEDSHHDFYPGENEIEFLNRRAEVLEEDLKNIRDRMNKIRK